MEKNIGMEFQNGVLLSSNLEIHQPGACVSSSLRWECRLSSSAGGACWRDGTSSDPTCEELSPGSTNSSRRFLPILMCST